MHYYPTEEQEATILSPDVREDSVLLDSDNEIVFVDESLPREKKRQKKLSFSSGTTYVLI